MTWAALLEQCLAHSAALGFSPGTLDRRRSALRVFITWCKERSISAPQDVTRPVLERYRRHLFYYRQPNGKPLSAGTQKNHLTDIKQFFKWLCRENFIAMDPAAGLALPKLNQPLPKAVLRTEEVEAVLNAASQGGGVRDRAILETLYATGIRRMELARLKLYDIDPEQGTLMVREGKGGKDRLIPIGERACRWIDKYLADVRPELVVDPNDATLFLTHYGEPFIKGRLTRLVKRHLAAAGIDKPGACHLFRHTMATLMLENGADLRFIQMMLGHADISTTTVYTRVSIRKLQAVYRRTHPADRGRAIGSEEEGERGAEEALLAGLVEEADYDPEE